MDLGITGKVAMVLGAGGGLGGAIARELASEGAHVVACARSEESMASLGDAPGTITQVRVDLRDLATLDAAVERVETEIGDVEILVNTTGGPPSGPVTAVDDASWNEHFQAMVLPIIHLTQRVLPSMRAHGWGRVITNTSSGVIAPIPNLGISNGLRSTLVGWSKTLAAEVGRDGVTVNTVAPGRIHTARIDQLDLARAEREGKTVAEVAASSAGSIPAGRYGTPAEYAAAVAFLCSSRASFINGTQLRVDGGMISNV